jgi:haloacetate dehalogenase
VAHRLAVDWPGAVARVAVLDILPTRTLLRETDLAFATAYWHWFFLLQSGGLPERMIGADPEWFVREILQRWAAEPERIDPVAAAEYVRWFTPGAIAASCADYRAAAGPDLADDDADHAAGRRVTQPLLALWGSRGAMGRMYDVLASWEAVAIDTRGSAVDSGHFLAEEAPGETLAALEAFLEHTAPGRASVRE